MNAEVLRTLVAKGFVPVVASIAMDEDGQAYNVNADVVASELAVAMEAEKLVYMNDVPGLMGPGGELIVGAVGRRSASTSSAARASSTAA